MTFSCIEPSIRVMQTPQPEHRPEEKDNKMPFETISYKDYETDLPKFGQHVVGQVLRGATILVYQAYKPTIASYAVEHQKFGGPEYSFQRMSWIKTNFLWMMYRSGWATKRNQERTLAIEIDLMHLEYLLTQAVPSSFDPSDVYADQTEWEIALKSSNIRLQWDPDHHPSGNRLQRRAVQLGMRGDILKQFGTEWIVSITDITDFVQEQAQLVAQHDWTNLTVMKESVVPMPTLNRMTHKCNK